MAHETYECDAHNLLVTVYSDDVTADEIVSGFTRLAELARDREGVAAICDFRRSRINLDTSQLRFLAAQSAEAARTAAASKRAILAGDDLTFGIGRMFCAFTDDQPTETQTFRDIGALAAWLGIERGLVEERLGAAD